MASAATPASSFVSAIASQSAKGIGINGVGVNNSVTGLATNSPFLIKQDLVTWYPYLFPMSQSLCSSGAQRSIIESPEGLAIKNIELSPSSLCTRPCEYIAVQKDRIIKTNTERYKQKVLFICI